jgi:leucyl/phenylalanyl-tRNA---protein transferase
MPVYLLSDTIAFPPPQLARSDGLLAVGGDLSQDRLLAAYHSGIFPWFGENEPILWWSPDPRLVLYPKDLHVSRRLKRTLSHKKFTVTLDRAFDRVITACARNRGPGREGTWIVDAMIDAYCGLHEAGYAHSVEVWAGNALAGGLYGISLGGAFFGESMFSGQSDASKVALVTLVAFLEARGFDFIDCQVVTPHLVRFGAKKVSRSRFLRELSKALRKKTATGNWHLDRGEERGG